MPTQPHGLPTPKIHLQVLKIAKLSEITFLYIEMEKSLTNSLFATVSLPNVKFDVFTSPVKLVSTSLLIVESQDN